MTALKTTSIAPALKNIARIREAREGAKNAVYDREGTVNNVLDLLDAGASLREAIEFAFNAGYVTGYLDGPDTAVASHAMLAAILNPTDDRGAR